MRLRRGIGLKFMFLSLDSRVRLRVGAVIDGGARGGSPVDRESRSVRRRYSAAFVADSSDDSGLRRVTRQGEEAIGKLAQELLENPVVSGALTAALQTRERAVHAQEAALSALNLPSASDLERLTRRLRSVSQRLEGIEDGLDRVEQKLARLETTLDERAAAAEEHQPAGERSPAATE